MDDTIYIINYIYGIVFVIWFAILFFLSIKKCFLKEGRSKVALFFLTLLTNPMVIYVGTMFATAAIGAIIISVSSSTQLTGKEPAYVMLVVVLTTFIYVFLTILFSRLIGKWLKAPNTSLVTFLYLMFSVIFALSVQNADTTELESPLMMYFINILSTTILFAATGLLYIFDINELAKLTDRKRDIKWKIFVLPPTIFCVIYDILAFSTINYGFEFETVIVLYVFSMIVLFLFIWAFSVIINNINARNEAIEAKDEVKALSVEVMEALAHTIDAKDKYTNGHSIRVAKYSRMIAEKMGLDERTCENIYYMGLLHDIGKIGVRNEIINKPTRLTDQEYDIIKNHPSIGYAILSEIKSRPTLAYGALWHHEHFDGKGYPEGKLGTEIPIEARIIAVADTYDAMTSNRSYRNYLPQDVVRSEIEKNSGTQFDPEAARCMLEIIDEDKDYVLHEI